MDVVVASACRFKETQRDGDASCGDDGRGIYKLESCSNTN